MAAIVLFDGECNFCDASVQFIIKRDPKGYFQFAAHKVTLGKRLNINIKYLIVWIVY